MVTVLDHYRDWLKKWKLLEQEGKIENAAFDLSQIFEQVTGISRYQMPLKGTRPLTEKELVQLEKAVSRRMGGYPLQYLLGEWEFYGLPFTVGEGVLIPRPDTETLVDVCLEFLKEVPSPCPSPTVLDLCSGSGCIAVAIASRKPMAKIYAVELSEEAFPYLLQNIQRNGAENVIPVKGDIFQIADTLPDCDLLVSNPPYLTKEEMEDLQREVSYEPALALYGEEDGLAFYRKITEMYWKKLRQGGLMAYEVGWSQSQSVCEILQEYGAQTDRCKDACGIWRVVTGKKEKSFPEFV